VSKVLGPAGRAVVPAPALLRAGVHHHLLEPPAAAGAEALGPAGPAAGATAALDRQPAPPAVGVAHAGMVARPRGPDTPTPTLRAITPRVGGVELRVEQLAAQADVSVDTVRFYQSKGLLPPPRREGRVAWYGDEHLRRLARIRSLQAKGLSLATIRRLLDGELDAADEALVTALTRAGDAGGGSDGAGITGGPGRDGEPASGEEMFGLDELAVRSGIPLPVVQAVARDGLLVPRRVGGQELYTAADVEIAAAGLALLGAGLPLAEVVELARRHHAAMRDVAHHAVELFDAHVRQPLRAEGLDDDEAARRLVEAFSALLPATTKLVTHHFRRTLLAVAQEHIERVGAEAELAAVAGAGDPERL